MTLDDIQNADDADARLLVDAATRDELVVLIAQAYERNIEDLSKDELREELLRVYVDGCNSLEDLNDKELRRELMEHIQL